MTDMKQIAQQVGWLASGFANGIAFVPQEKRNWKPAATSRSAQDILAHTTYWNLFFTRLLRGEGSWDVAEDAWTRSTKELKDSEQAKKLAEKSAKDLSIAIEKLSPQDLGKEVDLPWGKQTLQGVALSGLWHLTYHVGQLFYMQTMLGDTEDHL